MEKLKFMYKIIHEIQKKSIIYITNSNEHKHNTRTRDKLRFNKIRTERGRQSIKNDAAKLYNKLNED